VRGHQDHIKQHASLIASLMNVVHTSTNHGTRPTGPWAAMDGSLALRHLEARTSGAQDMNEDFVHMQVYRKGEVKGLPNRDAHAWASRSDRGGK
jgi:hypothetical protein